MEKPLLNLEGETPAGTADSSHAGRRVLSARIPKILPAIKVQ